MQNLGIPPSFAELILDKTRGAESCLDWHQKSFSRLAYFMYRRLGEESTLKWKSEHGKQELNKYLIP